MILDLFDSEITAYVLLWTPAQFSKQTFPRKIHKISYNFIHVDIIIVRKKIRGNCAAATSVE